MNLLYSQFEGIRRSFFENEEARYSKCSIIHTVNPLVVVREGFVRQYLRYPFSFCISENCILYILSLCLFGLRLESYMSTHVSYNMKKEFYKLRGPGGEIRVTILHLRQGVILEMFYL